MQLTSPAFENESPISVKYTCYGENTTPPFEISDVPEQTQSLVFMMHDPDAPDGPYIHCVAWNINPIIRKFDEGELPSARYGLNSANQFNYLPICPPRNTNVHRFVFTVSALDFIPDIPPGGTDLPHLMQAIRGHVLAQAQITALFSIDPYIEQMEKQQRPRR